MSQPRKAFAADNPYGEYVSPQNPYHTTPGTVEDGQVATAPEYEVHGVDVYLVPPLDDNELSRRTFLRATYLQKKSFIIQLLALFEAVLALIALFSSVWFLIPFVIAIAGYWGARNFERKLFIWFLAYYIFYTFLTFSYWIYVLADEAKTGPSVYFGLLIPVRIAVSWVMYRFYRMLPYNHRDAITVASFYG